MQASKRILIVVGICLGSAVGAMVFSAINTALASIGKDLSATVAQLQWIMNIFGVAICSTLVIFGRLADIYGRKKIYLIGILGLAVSMLGSGLAPNANWIIFFQIILGLSGAILIPVSQALISNVFPEKERSKAIGIWAAIIGIALAIGPLLSGAIIALLSWRWVFLINIPIILLSMLVVAIYVQESKSDEQAPHIDWSGAMLLAITIGSFVLAVIQGHLWPTALIVGLYILSTLSLVLLFYVEKKAIAPIIREDLFTNRLFLIGSLDSFCLVFFIWASFFLLPLYLQSIHHFPPFVTGLMMLFVTVPLVIFSFTGGQLYQNYGPKLLITIGFVFLILSALIQMQFQADTSITILALGAISFGIGWGIIWGPSTTAAISALPLNDAGIASGSFVTIQEIGGTIGLAITISVVRMQDTLLTGYHRGMWILIFICMIGLIATALIKKEALLAPK